jgi:hypothetical protein
VTTKRNASMWAALACALAGTVLMLAAGLQISPSTAGPLVILAGVFFIAVPLCQAPGIAGWLRRLAADRRKDRAAARVPAFFLPAAYFAHSGSRLAPVHRWLHSALALWHSAPAVRAIVVAGAALAVVAIMHRVNRWASSGDDRAQWASAQTMADLGGLVVAWLDGEVQDTPSGDGPPMDETVQVAPVLAAANRAGFVTENSQMAGEHGGTAWEAWVCGFATDDTLAALREAVPEPLTVDACRGSHHEGHNPLWPFSFCPGAEGRSLWARQCPQVEELKSAWAVMITDPEPGRNDRLWPALEVFAGSMA